MTKPELGLQHVPLEIFAQICSNLEPIWLWNLSHVCNSTHDRLSFQQGNLIWYNAVPNTLWKVAEQFQDERELRELMFSNVRKESYQFLIKPRLDSRPTRFVPRTLLDILVGVDLTIGCHSPIQYCMGGRPFHDYLLLFKGRPPWLSCLRE